MFQKFTILIICDDLVFFTHSNENPMFDQPPCLFCFILFCFVLFYFVLFYFVLFYFVLFYFVLFFLLMARLSF